MSNTCGAHHIVELNLSMQYALYIFTPDGRLQHSHMLSQGGISGLGVRSVEWHPSGRFLVVGGYDDAVRILNDISWSVSYELELPGSMWASPASRKSKGKMVGLASFVQKIALLIFIMLRSLFIVSRRSGSQVFQRAEPLLHSRRARSQHLSSDHQTSPAQTAAAANL